MPQTPFRYFAIFGAMRTGSNLLERSLDSYEGLTGLGELYNSVFVGKPNGEPLLGVTVAERNRDPVAFLNRVIDETPGIPGFRIFQGHDARMIDHIARDPSCAKIILRRSAIDSFVSLNIARETGQWMLTNEENRRLVKITFDATEYEPYRDELDAYYAMIRRKMRLAGQTPFEVSYGELRDLEILNGAATFIGAKRLLTATPQKIQRQNPVAWADKVTNPQDMQPYLADGSGTGGDVQLPPRFSALDELVASRGFSLIYAPVAGAGAESVRRFIRKAEGVAGVGGKPLATGLKDAHIARRRRRGGFVFTFLRHPALRAEDVFRRRIVATGEGTFTAVQALLTDQYDAPTQADMARDTAAQEVGFDAFIAFIGDNLAGRTAMREDPAWAPQTAMLAEYAHEAPPDFIGRCERAEEDGAYVLHRLGVNDATGALVKGFARDLAPEGAGGLVTPRREARLAEIYARDYARLGYTPLRGDGG